jgi:nicotinate dehydrogenase subunit A
MAEFALRVNGRTHRVEGEAGDNLLTVLRNDLNLHGSKFGCGEGHCGACTVMIDSQPMRSCQTRLSAATGKSITTIEGLAEGDRLHPVQEAFIAAEAFQCGYCTPGMVMAVVGLLAANPNPSAAEIAKTLDRNVCRCGTYPRIVRAIQDAARKMQGSRR